MTSDDVFRRSPVLWFWPIWSINWCSSLRKENLLWVFNERDINYDEFKPRNNFRGFIFLRYCFKCVDYYSFYTRFLYWYVLRLISHINLLHNPLLWLSWVIQILCDFYLCLLTSTTLTTVTTFYLLSHNVKYHVTTTKFGIWIVWGKGNWTICYVLYKCCTYFTLRWCLECYINWLTNIFIT